MSMENRSTERRNNVLLYGGAVLAVAALVWIGWVVPRSVEGESGARLSSAQAYLSMAAGIPTRDADGNRLAETTDQRKKLAWKAREENLGKALDLLDQVEEQDPGMAITREMRGYACWLREDAAGTLRWYREALVTEDHGPDLAHRVRLHIARIELLGQRVDAAFQALAEVAEEDRGTEWWVVKAQAHHARQEGHQRSQALNEALQRAGNEDSSIRLVAAAAFEMSDAMAVTAYEALQDKSAADWYLVARLKMEGGQADRAHNALRKARDLDAAYTARLIRKDGRTWQKDPVAQELSHTEGGRRTAAERPAK
ncbi:MAG: hypothetical protein R3F30_11965 [Planctomycetota bacterium]